MLICLLFAELMPFAEKADAAKSGDSSDFVRLRLNVIGNAGVLVPFNAESDGSKERRDELKVVVRVKFATSALAIWSA